MNVDLAEAIAMQDRRTPRVRRETVAVLVEHLSLAQRTAQWLGNETHGDAYLRVRELSEHLHQAQRILRDIQRVPVALAGRGL